MVSFYSICKQDIFSGSQAKVVNWFPSYISSLESISNFIFIYPTVCCTFPLRCPRGTSNICQIVNSSVPPSPFVVLVSAPTWKFWLFRLPYCNIKLINNFHCFLLNFSPISSCPSLYSESDLAAFILVLFPHTDNCLTDLFKNKSDHTINLFKSLHWLLVHL